MKTEYSHEAENYSEQQILDRKNQKWKTQVRSKQLHLAFRNTQNYLKRNYLKRKLDKRNAITS